jgi:DNA-binding NtrC family response regulator
MSKILVANADYAKRLLYQEELTLEGYEVITASDCEGLLETIAEHRPDLIILGIKTGEVNELNTLEEIRDAYYDMPVILTTDYLPVNTIQNLLQVIEKSHEVCLPELG